MIAASEQRLIDLKWKCTNQANVSANTPFQNNITPLSHHVMLFIPCWLKYQCSRFQASLKGTVIRNYNRLSVTCQLKGNFIIIGSRNAGSVVDKCIEDFCSSYHCAQTFWKSSRSNVVLTLQSVSPLWIFQPCRVRAL